MRRHHPVFTLFGSLLTVCVLAGCGGTLPKPTGYAQHTSGGHLTVKKTFSFVNVTGLIKAKTTLTLPEGRYDAIASDANGEYYLAPNRGRIPANFLFPDSYRGGIYRRSGTPARYFVFSMPITEMDLWTRGEYPTLVGEIPQSFVALIAVESSR